MCMYKCKYTSIESRLSKNKKKEEVHINIGMDHVGTLCIYTYMEQDFHTGPSKPSFETIIRTAVLRHWRARAGRCCCLNEMCFEELF